MRALGLIQQGWDPLEEPPQDELSPLNAQLKEIDWAQVTKSASYMKKLIDLHQINTQQGQQRESKRPLSDDAEDHFAIAMFERCFRTASREQKMAHCEQYE